MGRASPAPISGPGPAGAGRKRTLAPLPAASGAETDNCKLKVIIFICFFKTKSAPICRFILKRNCLLFFPFWNPEAALVRELATTLPHPVHYGTVEWNLKHLYEACTEVNNVDIEGARPLTKIIRNLGERAAILFRGRRVACALGASLSKSCA